MNKRKHNHPRIIKCEPMKVGNKKFWWVEYHGVELEPIFEQQTKIRTTTKSGKPLARPVKEIVDVRVGTRRISAVVEKKVFRRKTLRKLGVAI